jgi:hypothetical protein
LCRDTTPILQPAEHALDAIAAFVSVGAKKNAGKTIDKKLTMVVRAERVRF